MEFTETEDRVWKSEDDYEIHLFDFCLTPSFKVYKDGKNLGGFDTIQDAKTFAASHAGK